MTVETNSVGPPWTILKILEWTKGYFLDRGIDSPRLDAELLLSSALGLERVQLYAQFDRPLDDDELAAFRALVKERSLGTPVAYLVGRRGFWTFELEVDERVLIPRPETERLIEFAQTLSPKRVLDIGTGSGAIAIALALEFPDADVVATDVSTDALEVARANCARLAPEVTLIHSDLFDAVEGSFDLIASNPPYVASDDDAVEDAVRKHEPHVALFAEDHGRAIIAKLVPDSVKRLNAGGWLAIEIGYDQGDYTRSLFEVNGLVDVDVKKDLSGHDRVVCGRKPA